VTTEVILLHMPVQVHAIEEVLIAESAEWMTLVASLVASLSCICTGILLPSPTTFALPRFTALLSSL
jgi:hypothetical protein